jgi:hypothetical protein
MFDLRFRKIYLFFYFGIFLQYNSHAQTIAKLRFDDDFSYLKADSLKTTWKEKIKNVSLGTSFQLSLGGESREQYQSYEHVNFGEVPSDFVTDSPHQLMHRIMFHANLAYKNTFRLFAQLNNTARFLNPNPINSQIDENLLSTHQLFVDYKFNNHWIFRVGQQELAYGSERFVASREGPNTRLTFQAATLKYISPRNKLDFFTSKPMKMNTGVFDDVPASESLYGFYYMHSSSKSRFNVDLFYFNSESNLRQYMFKKGNENRHTFGTRLYSSLGPWNYDVELAKQVGEFDELSISSYMAVWDFNVSLVQYFYLGFSGNYVPGDKSNSDSQLNTFNTLYAKPPFGQTVSLNITNTINFSPYVRYQHTNKWLATLRSSFVTRESLADGIFTPNMMPLRPILGKNRDSNAQRVGNIFALDVNYFPTKNVSLQFELGYCEAGDYMSDTGNGRDVMYFALKNAFKF